ncbi:hypothetical protein ABWL39_01070 [Chitinivorax sp. PXF-14]|uniref:hypothetical protein n=1 Tax=Chitinivorax sp. PXF-14 TaxID=3230488 RepID=UPI0034671315
MKQALIAAGLAVLACSGVRAEVIASGMSAAENTFQTSNQRLFASSDGAFYEITRDGLGWHKMPVVAAFKDGGNRPCYYLGITESAGTLYTVCTESNFDPLARKHLFGLDPYQAVPRLTEAGELGGVALPNGLAADRSGNLYLADSGLPLLPGVIHKITLAGAYTIATQSVFHRFAACKPNGLKHDADRLYVSVNPFSYIGLSQLLRYDIGATGLANKASVYTSWAFLDDFALVRGGAVIAEFLGGRISHVSEAGAVLHTAAFSQPTSATLLTAPAFGAGSLLVTERGKGTINRFDSGWSLAPR